MSECAPQANHCIHENAWSVQRARTVHEGPGGKEEDQCGDSCLCALQVGGLLSNGGHFFMVTVSENDPQGTARTDALFMQALHMLCLLTCAVQYLCFILCPLYLHIHSLMTFVPLGSVRACLLSPPQHVLQCDPMVSYAVLHCRDLSCSGEDWTHRYFISPACMHFVALKSYWL